MKRDVKNKENIKQAEIQKLHFPLAVMRTLEVRIHFKGKTIEEKEEILTFFNQSLGNTFLIGDDGQKITVTVKIKKQIEKLTVRLHRIQRITSSIQLIKNNMINSAKEKYKEECGNEKDFNLKNFSKVKYNYIPVNSLKQSENEKQLYYIQNKLYKKITQIKNDFLHKTSHYLSKNNACIVMEKLNIKGMTKSQRRISLKKSAEYKEKLKQKNE